MPGMAEALGCGLGEVALLTRIQHWRSLIECSAQDRVVTDDGVRIRFRADPATARELRALVAAEHECCDAADWQVQEGSGELVLRVVTTADGVAALRQMLGTSFAGGSVAPQPEGSRP